MFRPSQSQNVDHFINNVLHEKLEKRDSLMDKQTQLANQNAMEEIDWQREIQLSDDYTAYRAKFTSTL